MLDPIRSIGTGMQIEILAYACCPYVDGVGIRGSTLELDGVDVICEAPIARHLCDATRQFAAGDQHEGATTEGEQD